MTSFTGCNGPSDKEVVDMFNDFITMFPSEDLTFLYDKEGEVSSVDGSSLKQEKGLLNDLSLEDKGTWVVSSSVATEQGAKSIGVSLRFNRNTQKATGDFTLYEDGGENITRYPIYYDKSGIYLINEDVPTEVKEKLENFKMMYEFIELDREYLEDLESTKIMYNPNAPIFDAFYKLDSDDKNITKIKELYPTLLVDGNNCTLKLHGSGTPWNMRGRLSLEISLDQNNNTYFTSTMSFKKSESSGGLIEGEK